MTNPDDGAAALQVLAATTCRSAEGCFVIGLHSRTPLMDISPFHVGLQPPSDHALICAFERPSQAIILASNMVAIAAIYGVRGRRAGVYSLTLGFGREAMTYQIPAVQITIGEGSDKAYHTGAVVVDADLHVIGLATLERATASGSLTVVKFIRVTPEEAGD